MGGCQNSGLFLGTLNVRRRIIIRIQRDHNVDNHPYKSLDEQHIGMCYRIFKSCWSPFWEEIEGFTSPIQLQHQSI